jgi:diguanylate cyclase (GGDEF)-like protein
MPLKNLSLLFVEDDRNTQEQMKMFFEDDVKEFYQAYDGREGFQTFLSKKPDIIITDINMPYSGLELTQKIKEINKKIPVIIMSAYDDKENLLKSINLCTNGFVTKPIDMSILYQQLYKVASALKTHRESEYQKKEKIDNLYRLAHYDSLTNIANRNLFDIELNRSIEEAKKERTEFALFFIDLDHFKDINDTYGHDVGDLILQEVVKNISKVIDKEDVLARRSGDEFLLIINHKPHHLHLKELASSILSNLHKSTLYNGISIKISCSIGISMYPKSSKNRSELLKLADSAMYYAKQSGKDRYCFADDTLKEISNIQERDRIVLNKELYWDKKDTFLVYKDKEIYLTKNETLFLASLFNLPNYRASYEIIYTYIWGASSEIKIGRIKTLVKVLRKKLPSNIIKNIFAIGYKIETQ